MAPSTIPAGTVLTLIDNTSATPIAGAFQNLADGVRLCRSNHTLRVSYKGGDGNDLTVTSMPLD